MDSFGWFLLASGLTLGLLLIPYRFYLSRLTHFKWNRFYLLSALGLCLFLSWPGQQVNFSLLPLESDPELKIAETTPLVTDPATQPVIAAQVDQGFDVPYDQLLWLEETANQPVQRSSSFLDSQPVKIAKWGLWGIYLIGLLTTLFGLTRGIIKVLSLFQKSPKDRRKSYTLVYPTQLPSSFSFFRLLFLSPKDRTSSDRSSIEAHELAHIRQWHSLDVLFAELVGCFWWFLPWSGYLKKSLKETHEYLADQAAAGFKGKTAYSRLLLHQTLSASDHLPVHYFAQSKTQKRIVMLNKSRSRSSALWAYIAIVPALFLALILMAAMPAPDSHDPVSEEGTAAMTFAGEALPDNPVYESGLQEKVNKLKSNPDYCRKLCLRGARFQKEIQTILEAEAVPSDFFYLAMAESALDPEANSSMGACGIWQFMPATARSYGMEVANDRDDRKDLALSTQAAAQYLKKYQTEFGTWTSAAIAYNRGPKPLRDMNGVNSQEMESLYQFDHERGYLYSILAVKLLFEDPGAFGIQTGPDFGVPFAKSVNWGQTSGFGPRISPITKKIKNHNGIDLKAELGTEVLAVSDGLVRLAETVDSNNGHLIELSHHSPMSSRYHHLDEVRVKPGQQVKKGDVIGTVGNTGLSLGPHLHLEIRENDVPVDPELYIRF